MQREPEQKQPDVKVNVVNKVYDGSNMRSKYKIPVFEDVKEAFRKVENGLKAQFSKNGINISLSVFDRYK